MAETQRMSGARMVGVGRPQMAGAAAWTPAEAELAGYGAELNADEEQSAITLRSRRLDSPSPVFGNRRARTKRNVAPARPGVQAAVTGKERL
ncbi:MAG TPA: hypothetical protein VFB15_11265 [Candidatus Binataceae bacterium]|nr:hypothetical protein [Candidatus Binataceae bacterium]